MLLKEYLKPENKEVTSFIMKNIVFCVCESHPESRFVPDLLLYWVRRCLKILERSLELGFIPYYMIPARNLLQGKFSLKSEEMFLLKLSRLLKSVTHTVFRCRKLSVGKTLLQSNTLEEWSWKRNRLEKSLYGS